MATAGRPLANLRVVECATYVAGPSGGMTLAQLGADVIRVDPLGGATDNSRWPLAPGGASLYWHSLNKGKRSVTVDLRSPVGRELVTALITAPGPDSGVFLDNNVARSWMDWPTLSARRPDLVHVHVQGHRDGRPAVDYTVNAAAGIPDMTGSEAGGAPVNHVLPAWDLLTGQTAVVGLLAALRHRDRTGEGSHLEVALADVALAGVAALGWYADAQLSRTDRPRHGNHVYGSFGVDFPTADGGRVMVVALTEGQWRSLCRVTGTGEVFAALEKALGVDLEDEVSRYRHRETIEAVLRGWFAARDVTTVSRELEAARVLWGPYRTPTQVVRDHEADPAASPLVEVQQPGIGRMLAMGSPLRAGGTADPPRPAPVLGADTDAVLADVLGLGSAEIGRLHDDGVLAPVAADR
ncbi:CoA transferase [Blastococcus xanthinilyticus]|uniref:CoA transferase n=1 Tax=Blastococcus xanthinilyticus TaxID=1564164 RepID=UPI00141374E9|nr:CoA transferase [Blastococcus xanthinilyticus]